MFCGVQEILQGEFSRDWPEHKLVCGFETDEFDKLAFGALPTQLRAPRRLPFKLDLAAHERQLKEISALDWGSVEAGYRPVGYPIRPIL
ncbi:uncharacterized protein STEHIDRAFT_157817 [Stereum hirsutum FP-91666 SS1]|uniref:uncharacterized protein n=1 Tax=Stereum hirsutum (strain FP-91666) TaxID=721885 RepID=UPI0004449456|nr:uncharacterized protein STEHIDRAFT_157817 [Stereum hirsutum FP-91666 SS1]EIM86316.1 hypothetical protein STEHIDRAFT_157817 [Stereum hirsutum FP-91666 SS1]